MGIENSCTLIGNVGDDPKTSYTQGGTTVTKISLATTSKRKDRDGNQREFTEWHRVTFFGRLGDIAAEYLRKGSAVAVQGSIRYSESEKDGVKRYYTEIIADRMKMLGGRPEGERTERAPREQRPSTQRSAPPPVDDFNDDDIPF